MMKLRILFISLAIISLFSACGSVDAPQTWRPVELAFNSTHDYSATGADEIMMDVIFTNKKTGETVSRPAFWDGDNRFLVRFAPISEGKWEWESSCAEDESLNAINGVFKCVAYDGDLAIYRNGFVKATPGIKYLTDADGTPFFYLGDTHWGMFTEEYDSPGPHAGNTGASSHFKYIVDRRVEQGFTVYQSEPISAPFRLQDGKVDQEDIEGFRLADKYFQYIADAGLVHANAQFFFPSDLKMELAADDKKLEAMSRYWVARFGAYPVMWTLGQEIDNDSYNESGYNTRFSYKNNPWVKIAEFIHKHDSYSHPLSGHQESNVHTTVTGAGWKEDVSVGRSASIFMSEEVADRTGHNWWAAQWTPQLLEPVEPELIRDYWNSPRPAVNYEGRYCGLWTKDFGSRVQGWAAYLSGFFGYGYGAIDIWLYNSSFDAASPSYDTVDTITVADKLRPWCESIEYPSANQMRHLRAYMESFDWWNLVPVLSDEPGFTADAIAYAYAKTKDRHVLYFFNKDIVTGTLSSLQPTQEMELSWFNPRTGEKAETLICTSDASGKLVLPHKPDNQDWVLSVDIVTAK